jgi:hypothetical protein
MSLGSESNEISQALNDLLGDEWAIEAEGVAVGRAYLPDPTDPDVDMGDVVSVEIRTDFDAPYTIQTTAHNEARGMGDLHDSDTAKTLADATSAADTLASEVREA